MITWARIGRVLRNPARAGRMAMQATLFRRALVHPLAKFIGPKAMAALAAKTLDTEGYQPDCTSVLVLDRLYFSKDVDILREYGQINYVLAHTHVLSVTQEAWLPKGAQVQIDYVAATGLEAEAGWSAAEAYARALIEGAQARYDITAVLASNVDYWQHEGFRRACTAMGMPFLVLCQELQTVPSVYDESLRLYRTHDFRYTGDSVAVFGKATADMLIECQCCTPEQVVVTGAPRLDPWLNDAAQSADQDTITLLAFDGDQYFAPQCYLETLNAFAQASLKPAHAHLNFVLKAKDGEDEARALTHLAKRPHRLTITHDEPLTSLFPRSRLVIGYISIAVIEALFSRATIAIPQWGDAQKPAREQNIDPTDPETQRLIQFLPSVDALSALMAEVAQAPAADLDTAAREALVWRWFHKPGTGGATGEVEAYIRARIAVGTPQ